MEVGANDRDLMGLILKKWWVVALSVAVGALLAAGALYIVPNTYTATATQLIKGVPGSGTGAPYLAAQFAVARAKSYPSFINSTTVLDSVRSDLGPEFSDERLRDQLSASNPADTPLVHVTATGSTPREAQDLANSASRHLARFITQIETVSGTSPVIVETAVQAGLPATPSSPQPLLFMALGLSGGFTAGIIAIIAVDTRRRRTRVGAKRAHQETNESSQVSAPQPRQATGRGRAARSGATVSERT